MLLKQSHSLTMGGDLQTNRADLVSQRILAGRSPSPGVATGNAFADFLVGLPGASAIAFGDSKTRLRAAYDAYVNDDWRLRPNLTLLNVGVRWEYEAPYRSLGRLASLDVAPGFTAIHPVLATNPSGRSPVCRIRLR